jgi:phosphoglycolate phosphatase
MTIKLIIFDFDGTIADTHDALLKIANRLSSEFGYQPLNAMELELLKNLSSREIIKQSRISPMKLPFLLKRVKIELGKEIQDLSPISGIEMALARLKKEGYQLGILTSNRKTNVITFLEKNNMLSLFDFIFSEVSLFGKHKVLERILKQYRLNSQEVVYVGDETRDINAARKSRVKAFAVGWGFNSPAILAQHQPDCLVDCPAQLVEALGNSDRVCQKVF